jgi:hypothetical protein
MFHNEIARPAQNPVMDVISRANGTRVAHNCTNTRSNGVRSNIFPLARQLNATPDMILLPGAGLQRVEIFE